MSGTPLREIESRITALREKMAAGKASLDTGVELDSLLQERAAIAEGFDSRIEMLRKQVAVGKATPESMKELNSLLDKRNARA